MPDERLITEIESILNQVVELGAATERTRMVPNLLVRNSNPGLTGFILVRDDRDGDNILARTVPGVIYNTNDLVNVLFIAGGEAIAFQQGSASASGNIWGIVSGTSTDIFYNSGDVGIGKTVAPDARLELLDTAQAQLRLTFEEDTKFVDFTLDTNHDLTIDPSSTGLIKLNATVTIPGELQHEGDTDTKIGFTDDDIEFTVGNLSMLKLTETAQDLITLGPGSGDVDIDFNGDMFLRGSDGFFTIGTGTPIVQFHCFGQGIFESTSQWPFFSRRNVSAINTPISFAFSLKNSAGDYRDVAFASAAWSDNTATTEDGYFTVSTRNSGSLSERLRVDTDGNMGIGTTGISARLHVDQSSTTAAIPVLLLDQADVDEPFTKYVGTAAAATLTRSIVDEGDVTTATRIGWVKIEIDDLGNQVTDGDYFVPFYSLA